VAKKLGKVKVTIVAIFGNKNNFLRKKPIDKIKNSYRWSKRKIKKYFYFSKKLKEKKILIPTLFFKIIENREKNFKRCFIYPNIKYNIKKDKLRDHLIDCSIIENEIRAHYLKSSYELSKN
ncbi:MAG: hypothetical protein GXO02_05010, partial [Epsilonproteobacteria bacterium]|nr:hypothetical protein [Campylobacterota bacterium]